MVQIISGDSLGDLQTALYGLLSSDEDVAALIQNKLYDDVPQDPDFPYVVFDNYECAPFWTHGRKGERVIVTLTAWSKEGGFKQVQAIRAAVQKCLFADYRIPVTNWCVVGIEYVSTRMARTNEDGEILRYCEYRFAISMLPS